MGLGVNENSSHGTLNPSVKWEKFPYNASKKLKLDTNKGAQNKKTEATERENDKNSQDQTRWFYNQIETILYKLGAKELN